MTCGTDQVCDHQYQSRTGDQNSDWQCINTGKMILIDWPSRHSIHNSRSCVLILLYDEVWPGTLTNVRNKKKRKKEGKSKYEN